MTRLATEDLRAGYGGRGVLVGLDVRIPDGELTVIVGPNACGKSTLLRALARLLPATGGRVLLDGGDITRLSTKEVARRMGLLPQSPLAPEGITVADLVGRGRYPHQSVLSSWSADDERAVTEAMAATNVTDLAERNVDELSGGQRQRAWIAMALAQETPILLLDEPTTFLDIGHQIEVLELVTRLHQEGRTVVVVLHDINQAARYASHLVAMKDGRIVAEGAPRDIVDARLLTELFDLEARVIADPDTGAPVVLPGR
ncbi:MULTISPECIES: ABC transporter ATP-binding protein [unclassified Microbacterium]|uniref:ABC transporter ATP-binding protein n=1 Tax=unclassified Microbacterium TaxID=2609290 RepID=UPI001604C3B9|nr:MULTISPECIES: ABC transporter ATP-binding protein [unclassified Microbacterium]QNA93468.1 ABC transporter ATP-binding protein [Microbacterium sp. Se63.02b]QYM63711.1 ABC transporter ATP-binding protein [Microbacterium sp. Se5.02b]